MIRVLLAIPLLLAFQADEDLTRRRDTICTRIEEIRGVKFAKPVPIQEGTRKDYANLVLENAHEIYGADFKPFERTVKALGLIGKAIKLERTIPMAAIGSLPAYYGRGTVYVVDRAVKDDELVYKFTQNLSEQIGDWKKRAAAAGTNFDALMALLAMRHGDSDMTKQLFWANLKIGDKHPDADHLKKQIEGAAKTEEGNALIRAVMSPLLTRPSQFMWLRGGIFMETMREEGGAARISKVYETPPASTEQVLHPEKYLKGEAPVALATKPVEDLFAAKGLTPLYQTTFGELGTLIYFDAFMSSSDTTPAAGWAGDRLLSWTDAKDLVVVAWLATWDTEDDAKEFEAAMSKAVDKYNADSSDANAQILRKEKATVLFLNVNKNLVPEAMGAAWKSVAEK